MVKKNETTGPVTAVPSVAVLASTGEPEYTVAELAEASQTLFKVRQECVVAALQMAEKHTTTVKDAKRIVNEFCKKEVK